MQNSSLELKISNCKSGISAFLAGDFEQAIKFLTESAEAGVSLTQFLLGSIYFDEKSIEEYTQNEKYLLDRSIKILQSDTLSNAILNKKAEFVDSSKAVKWLTSAAKSGFGPAQFILAICYQSGNGVERDFIKAHHWMLMAASNKRGDSLKLACNQLLHYFSNGTMVESMEVNDIVLRLKNTVSDDYINQAQGNLGVYYIYEFGVERNVNEAIKWFKKAADNDYAPAIFALGQLYDGDTLGERRLDLAFEYYMKSAELGYNEAQYSVGDCYYRGEGVQQSKDKALSWWMLAANGGNIKAQYNLGLCYFNGDGTEKNEIEAVKLFKMAADGGFAEAKCMLGICYEAGLVYGKGNLAAKELYEEAANMGIAEAQFRLGIYYYKSNHLREAITWLRKAASFGHVNAQVCLNEITNPNG